MKDKETIEELKKIQNSNDFLQALLNTSYNEIPLYLSAHGAYIYSVLLPQKYLKAGYINELMNWSCMPDMSWGMDWEKTSITNPLEHAEPKLLKNATPITFLRNFEGCEDKEHYVEINQMIIHLHKLHFINEKKAYCKLNQEGEIEETIKVHCSNEETIISIKQDTLDLQMFLTKSVLVRFFDWDSFKLLGNKRGIH